MEEFRISIIFKDKESVLQYKQFKRVLNANGISTAEYLKNNMATYLKNNEIPKFEKNDYLNIHQLKKTIKFVIERDDKLDSDKKREILSLIEKNANWQYWRKLLRKGSDYVAVKSVKHKNYIYNKDRVIIFLYKRYCTNEVGKAPEVKKEVGSKEFEKVEETILNKEGVFKDLSVEYEDYGYDGEFYG